MQTNFKNAGDSESLTNQSYNSPLTGSHQLVFTADEAAAILKVNKKTIYRLVDRNLLHATKTLRHLRITKKSLDQFLAT